MTGGKSDGVGAGSVAVRLSIADARLSTTDGSVALPPVGKLPSIAVGAASERQVAATTGTVSTVYVVMMTSLVMKENSVGLGHASVVLLTGAVGPTGTVELPVGNGGGVVVAFEEVEIPVESEMGRVNDPVRSPSLGLYGTVEFWVGTGMVEFSETGGRVTEGGTVVEFDGTLGVSTTIVMFVVGVEGGRMVDRLPVEKDGTVE
jgi:hypothetical protein